jgi:hypothetical protein
MNDLDRPDRPRHNAAIYSNAPPQRAAALAKHIAWFEGQSAKSLTPIAATLVQVKLRQWRGELRTLPTPPSNP